MSLLKEYKRELARFVRDERPDYPPFPENYFTRKTEAILEEHKERVLAAHAARASVPELPDSILATTLDNTWHDTAEAVIDNWIGKVYQITNNDRKLPFMDGVDAGDPLGLKR